MIRMKYASGAGLLIFFFAVSAWSQLVNPGFEETYAVDAKTGYQKQMEDNQWSFLFPLIFPKGWRLNISLTRGGKYQLLTGSENASGGKNSVYVRGHLMHEKTIDVTAGDKLAVSLDVRDPDKKPAGVCFYFYERSEKGTNVFAGSRQFTIPSDAAWTRQTGNLDVPEENTGKRVNSVIMALFSDTGAYFDNVELTHTRTARWLNYKDAMIEGNKKVAAGDHAGARDDFNSGLSMTSIGKEKREALLKIAETHRAEKNFLLEVETYRRIIETGNPDPEMKVEMYLKISDAYINVPDYSRARETLANILDMGREADGKKAEVQLKIADTWLRERKYAEAIESFEKIMKMEQAGPLVRVATRFRIGDTYLSARENEKAKEEYLKILSMRGTTFVDKFEAYRKTGEIYRIEKDNIKAREFYALALNVEDVNPWSEASLLSVLAGTFVSESRFEEARECYRRILDIGLDAWSAVKPAYIKIGETYRKEENYSREREVYDEMLNWANDNIYRINIDISGEMTLAYADWYRVMGDSYWAQGDKEKAKEFYLLFLEVGKKRPAGALIKEVEGKIGQNEPASQISNGEYFLFTGKHDEAMSEFQKVLESEKSIPRQRAAARMKMGDIYLEKDDFEKARKEYQGVAGIKDAPASSRARALILAGDSYSIEKKYARARGEYSRVLLMQGLTPADRIEAQERIAGMYRAELDYARAKTEYGKILDMEGLPADKMEEIRQRMDTIYR